MELTCLIAAGHLAPGRILGEPLLKGGTMKELYEMKGEGQSICGIARDLGISGNSVRK